MLLLNYRLVILAVVIIGQADQIMCFSSLHSTTIRSALAPHARQKYVATSEASATLVMKGASIDPEIVFNTWEWCANLGAPAALVAGAVLATLIEGRETLSPKLADKAYIRTLKKACRLLLLTSFGLEVISIFVTTVCGTMLLSIGDVFASTPAMIQYKSPIGFLMHNFEFEFLTAHMCFLQGLFNWLGSVALELLIPKKGEGRDAKSMNRFISSSLLTIVLGMLSFLNSHLYFYNNYANMWRRYAVVTFQKYFCPPTPMSFVLVPAILRTTYLGYKAFRSTPDEDDEE